MFVIFLLQNLCGMNANGLIYNDKALSKQDVQVETQIISITLMRPMQVHSA